MNEEDLEIPSKEELNSTSEMLQALIRSQETQIKETEEMKSLVGSIIMPAISTHFQDVGFVAFAIKDFFLGGVGSIAIFYIIQLVDLIIGLSSKPESYQRVEWLLSWIQSLSIFVVFATLFIQLVIKAAQSIIIESDRFQTEVRNVVSEHLEELKNADSSTDEI